MHFTSSFLHFKDYLMKTILYCPMHSLVVFVCPILVSIVTYDLYLTLLVFSYYLLLHDILEKLYLDILNLGTHDGSLTYIS